MSARSKTGSTPNNGPTRSRSVLSALLYIDANGETAYWKPDDEPRVYRVTSRNLDDRDCSFCNVVERARIECAHISDERIRRAASSLSEDVR